MLSHVSGGGFKCVCSLTKRNGNDTSWEQASSVLSSTVCSLTKRNGNKKGINAKKLAEYVCSLTKRNGNARPWAHEHRPRPGFAA